MRQAMVDAPRPSSDAAAAGLLARYIDAHERRDLAQLEQIVHRDVRITMPPEPAYSGRAAALEFFEQILGANRPGDWRLVSTSANGRPAVVNYLRPSSGGTFAALSIDVLHVRDDRIAVINCFLDARLAIAFGRPATLD
jgi:RNA polymerase sigma-70 factor (ECF subfamily)